MFVLPGPTTTKPIIFTDAVEIHFLFGLNQTIKEISDLGHLIGV